MQHFSSQIIISATTGAKRQIDTFVNYSLYRDQLIWNCLQNTESTTMQITLMTVCIFTFHYSEWIRTISFKKSKISSLMCFCRYMPNINNESCTMLLSLLHMYKKLCPYSNKDSFSRVPLWVTVIQPDRVMTVIIELLLWCFWKSHLTCM